MPVKLREKPYENKTALYLDVWRNGKRSKEYLKLYLYPGAENRSRNRTTKLLAEKLRAEREMEIEFNPHGASPIVRQRQDFLEYFRVLSETGGRPRAWKTTLLHLEQNTGGKLMFSDITPEWLESFQSYLIEQDLNPNSALTYYHKVKAALRHALRQGIIQVNPADRAQKVLRKQESHKVYLTIEEIRALNDAPCPNPEVKRAFLFSCFSGLRLSDVIGLKWTNFEQNQLKFIQKKTGFPEYMPLNQSALELLGTPGQPDECVFRLSNSHWVTWDAIQKWTRSAGITKHLSFHVSRHTFATLSYSSGVDLYTISELLGHREIRTTQVYARIMDSKRQEAVNRLPSLI